MILIPVDPALRFVDMRVADGHEVVCASKEVSYMWSLVSYLTRYMWNSANQMMCLQLISASIVKIATLANFEVFGAIQRSRVYARAADHFRLASALNDLLTSWFTAEIRMIRGSALRCKSSLSRKTFVTLMFRQFFENF